MTENNKTKKQENNEAKNPPAETVTPSALPKPIPPAEEPKPTPPAPPTDKPASPADKPPIVEEPEVVAPSPADEPASPADKPKEAEPASPADKPEPAPEVKKSAPSPSAPIETVPEPILSSSDDRTSTPKASKPSPANEVNFATRFKNKLTELRGQANKKRQEKVQENLDKIMEYAFKTQKVVNDDVERIIGVKDTQATKYLNTLTKQGKLVKFGKTTNIFYKPIKK